MNILVTGGAGFIGLHLCKKLVELGHEVTILDNFMFSERQDIPNVKIIVDDIRHNIISYFKGIDVVFHLAGISSLPTNQSQPYDCFSINVAGTANVLEAARLNNVEKVIFASTSAIYENNKIFPCSEHSLVNPNLLYSISKLQAEQICKSFCSNYGMKIPIVRYFNVYGPDQDIKRKSPPLTAYLIKCFRENIQPILHSNGEQKRDYVYIDDIVNLNLICMSNHLADNGIFNACSETVISVNDIYYKMANLFNSDLKPIYNSSDKFWDKYPSLNKGFYPLKAHVLESEVNKFTLGSAEEAYSKLGWETTITIDEGLKRIVNHYKEKI